MSPVLVDNAESVATACDDVFRCDLQAWRLFMRLLFAHSGQLCGLGEFRLRGHIEFGAVTHETCVETFPVLHRLPDCIPTCGECLRLPAQGIIVSAHFKRIIAGVDAGGWRRHVVAIASGVKGHHVLREVDGRSLCELAYGSLDRSLKNGAYRGFLLKLYLALGGMDIDIDGGRIHFKFEEITWLRVVRDYILVACHEGAVKPGVTHVAPVDYEKLQRPPAPCMTRVAHKACNLYNCRIYFYGKQLLVKAVFP